MQKIYEFLKSHIIVVKWTCWYFFALWLILRFIFKFDMFDAHYWWKFFHATLHGFGGFVFGILIYSAIPIYIATTATVYRKNEYVIKIPFLDKIFGLFAKKTEAIEETTEEPVVETPENKDEYPDDLPRELRVPFQRAKNHLSLTGAISVYNKQKSVDTPQTPQQIMDDTNNDIPLPTDFDISENFDTNDDGIPTFTDINFNEPTPEKLENNTTKYFESKNIEFETYHEFVATEKYLIYEHNDTDFWIMDENTWFAAGKQIDSPTDELLEVAKQNGLIPVIYLQSQNIMDIENTINNFENNGVRVIKKLEELD